MQITKGVYSYFAYSALGGGAVLINQNTPGVDKVINTIETTKIEAHWLYLNFPELVNAGVITVSSGHIYIYGIALTDIVTMVIAVVSLLFLGIKSVTEFSATSLSKQIKKLELLERQRAMLEEEREKNKKR